MLVLSPANATLILSTLLSSGLFRDTVTPEQMVLQLARLYGNEEEVMKIANTTQLAVSYVKGFLNDTMLCVEEMEYQIPRTTILTLVFVVDTIRARCFGLKRIIPTTLQCHNEDLSGINFAVMFTLGFVFVAVTMFTRQRRKACLTCCCGYPGPVIPLNMLDRYENRRGFMLSFGLVATLCLNVLLSNYERLYGIEVTIMINSWPKYTQIFVKILSAVFISITAYPFFVCQNMKNRVLGSIMGIFFCSIWISLEAYRGIHFMSTCFKIWAFIGYGEVVGVLLSLTDYPLYICLFLLLVKYIFTLVKTVLLRIRRRQKGEHLKHWMFENDTDWKSEYMYLHVKNLLKTIPKKEKCTVEVEKSFKKKSLRGKFEQAKAKFKNSFYKYKPEFKYSTRMMSSVFVTYIGMYQVTIAFSMYAYVIFLAFDLIFDVEIVKKAASLINLDVDLIMKWVDAVAISWWLGLITALTFSILVMINSIGWYRKHMMMLRKGDYTFLPRPLRKKKFNSASLMVASMKFAGFQVAYASWGFLILAFLLFFVYFIVITQICFAIRDGELTLLLKLLLSIWPTIVIAIFIFVIQYIMAIKLFLFDKMTLQVDNRRIYHIVSYTMFYFNIFLGLVSCLLRIIFSMVFGLVFLQRLQKSTLPRSAELIDPGYCSYLGYILLEHQHSNPVIQCFTRLLMESVHKELCHEINFEKQNDFSMTKRGFMPAGFLDATDMGDIKFEIRRKKRIKIRWHLFTLLSLNPSLLRYRFKNAVKKQKFNLDLFNRLNPRLYWTDDSFRLEKEKKDEFCEDGKSGEDLAGRMDVGGREVDVRYHRSGTVLEVIYTLKRQEGVADAKANHLFAKRKLCDNEVDTELGSVSDLKIDKNGGAEDEDNMKDENNIELLKYRRLKSVPLTIDGDDVIETDFILTPDDDVADLKTACDNQPLNSDGLVGSECDLNDTILTLEASLGITNDVYNSDDA